AQILRVGRSMVHERFRIRPGSGRCAWTRDARRAYFTGHGRADRRSATQRPHYRSTPGGGPRSTDRPMRSGKRAAHVRGAPQPWPSTHGRDRNMDCFLIRGGTALNGTVDISGSKNSSLPILAATLMAGGVSTLHGVPRLSDIDSMTRLLESLGCRVTRHEPASLGGSGQIDFKGRPALNGPLEIEVTDPTRLQAHYDI